MDTRVERIFHQEMKDDKSFLEKESGLQMLFGGIRYSKLEARDIWHRGVKLGIEIGLRKASLEGQRIELRENSDSRHKNMNVLFLIIRKLVWLY
jgi:hypothetical protein